MHELNESSSIQPHPRGLRYEQLCWPKVPKRALLRAIFCNDEEQAEALFSWSQLEHLDHVDYATRRLMPLLRLRPPSLSHESTRLMGTILGLERLYWCSGQLLAREAGNALRLLASAGIPCLVLKGGAVLPLYGGSLGLRPMADLDVLVRRENIRSALQILLSGGWQLEPRARGTEVEEQFGRWHSWSLKKGYAEVDVHWNALLEDLSESADDGLWSRATPGEVFGAPALIPSSTDLLLQICVHGARYSATGNSTWAADASFLLGAGSGLSAGANVDLHGDDIDWPLLIDETSRRYLQIPMSETLRFLSEHLGAAIPAAVLDALHGPDPESLFWCDYHAHSAAPAANSAVHRAAAKLVSRLRAGERLPAGLLSGFRALGGRAA